MTLNSNHTTQGPWPLLHLGTDLVYIPRLASGYARFGMRYPARFLTPQELAYCQGQGDLKESVFLKRVAGRIAIKEAASKALGTGLNGLGWCQGVYWQDLEVLSQPKSPPDLVLTGRALQVSTELGIRHWRISLSHDGDYAMATVIGLSTG
ncbi:holo-ACP synthase [Vampirovibrio sp.]|uniref:holo-ACP synthase n=1 Tax=Vampirovibrio sp. TaxID=2717857 RepID=UPI003593981A